MKPNNIILGNYHLNKPVYLLKSKFKDGYTLPIWRRNDPSLYGAIEYIIIN